MKKLSLFVLGLLILTGSALATIECGSVTVCTLAQPDGRCHPAVVWNNTQAQTVAGTFSACDGADCGKPCSDPVPFEFAVPEGLVGVFLTFEEEPPSCTTLSTRWALSTCDPACGNHHCVTPDCPFGMEKLNLTEITVQ